MIVIRRAIQISFMGTHYQVPSLRIECRYFFDSGVVNWPGASLPPEFAGIIHNPYVVYKPPCSY